MENGKWKQVGCVLQNEKTKLYFSILTLSSYNLVCRYRAEKP
jgi:hypothetical protein